uniref:G_PROTEIN_RECEP_F1_2 domain-containing protein n=2 Tax=Panagrellus redivivus TaxID=6233 RepID=A0A7E4VNF1_PANRE
MSAISHGGQTETTSTIKQETTLYSANTRPHRQIFLVSVYVVRKLNFPTETEGQPAGANNYSNDRISDTIEIFKTAKWIQHCPSVLAHWLRCLTPRFKSQKSRFVALLNTIPLCIKTARVEPRFSSEWKRTTRSNRRDDPVEFGLVLPFPHHNKFQYPGPIPMDLDVIIPFFVVVIMLNCIPLYAHKIHRLILLFEQRNEHKHYRGKSKLHISYSSTTTTLTMTAFCAVTVAASTAIADVTDMVALTCRRVFRFGRIHKMLAPDPDRSLRLRIRSRCLPFGGSAPGSGSGSYDTEPPAPEPGHGSGAAPKKFKKIFERVNCPKNSR